MEEANGNGMIRNGGPNGVFQDFNETWIKFDVDKDDGLNLTEFRELCKNLFQNGKGDPYNMEDEMVERIFKIFDANSNGYLCKKEFRFCFENWVSKIVNPVSVFVIVDVQNDFLTGSLALKNGPAGQDGKEVIPPINKLVETVPFRQQFYTKDWHPSNHISFFDNLHLRKLHESSPVKNEKDVKLFDVVVVEGDSGQPVEQKLWPRHCVMESWGAELDLDLKLKNGSIEVRKGMVPDLDSYSAFMDNDKTSLTNLKGEIDAVGGTDVYVCGVAYDVCVGSTAVDSLNLGYRTILIEDATKGLDLQDIENMRQRIKKLNGIIVDSDEVNDMVQGKDRRPEMGLYLANRLKSQMESDSTTAKPE